MITNALLSALRQVVSPAYVLTDGAELDMYGGDASGMYAQPGVVVFPASEEELARVVRLLSDAEHPVTIRGAGSGVAGGAVPTDGGAIVALGRMCEPVTVDLDSGIAVAPAGARLIDVERAASRVNRRLGDPIRQYGVGSVGAAVARNGDGFGGSTGVLHGTLRGIRAVRSDGSVFDTLADGPHLQGLHGAGLLLGSEGGLGVVTRASFQLRQRMPADRIVLAAFEDVIAAAEAGAGVVTAGGSPAMADVFDRSTWSAADAWPGGDGADGILLVWISGLEADVADEAAWVVGACRDYGAQRATMLDDDAFRVISTSWRQVLMSLGFSSRRIPVDLAVPLKTVPGLLEALYRHAAQRHVSVSGVTRILRGLLAMQVPIEPGRDESLIRASRFVEEMVEQVHDMQGVGMALHGIGARRLDLLDATHQQSDLEVLRSIRQVFAPNDLFAVPVVPPPPKERRNTRERRAREVKITKLRGVLAKQMQRAAEHGEDIQIQVPSARVLGQIVRTSGDYGLTIAVHDRPAGCPVDISLAELKRIVMVDPDSRLIAADAGATLTSVQDAAQERGLWLPVSPLVDRGTSVGDYVSFYRADSRRLGYGSVESRVVGLEAVTGRGDVFSWGGLVGMQHSGARLSEICIGMRHRYAVTTAVAMELATAPGMRATVRAQFGELAHAEAAVRRWLGIGMSDEVPKCSPIAACVVAGSHTDDGASDGRLTIGAFVEFAGVRSSVERQVRWARHIADEAGAVDLQEAYDAGADDVWIAARENYRQWPGDRGDGVLHLVMWTDTKRWADLARKSLHVVRLHGYDCRMLVDLGAGRIDILAEEAAVEPGPLVHKLCDVVTDAESVMEIWSSELAGKWYGDVSVPLETIRADLKVNLDPVGVLPFGWGRKVVRSAPFHSSGENASAPEAI